ncbi:MocR-like pyridoxine biosynthesis transcription factor PdxR [Neobacillus bataviensis]|uniref:MocR-like pyridoxine biosynthesis transcription factor PdxR n=1 Tax=Neobacillus bataviensis TaxID=220685 RepID=UPI001CC18937|nr:PLP-dependent aminotransferase family protein [Neobacillus bataviensis]
MQITPFLKKDTNVPIYLQLYQFFREEIERGSILTGKKLPSIRELSQSLNISRNTVDTAYQQLIAEGYVESREKSGLYVLELDEIPMLQEVQHELKLHHVEGKTNHLIDFQYGDIELERFPLKVWKKCLMAAIDAPSHEVFSYGDKKGHYGLRTEIASYLYQGRGVRCSPDQIILSAGTQTAVNVLIQLLSLQNSKVALENPGYDGVRYVFESQKCEVIPISLEEDGINITELEKSSAQCVYVTPSHQFPIGMILPIQKRMKLLQWAEKNQTYIIEDDYDGEFRYAGQPIPSLKSLDTNEKVIYLGTFSKAFLPAARVTYIVLPEPLVESYHSKLFFLSQTVSPHIQEALYLFMKEGHFGRHIRKMRKIYQGKQAALIKAIECHLGDKVNVIGQKAGLHLLLELKDLDAIQLVEKAEEFGIRIYLTEKFWLKRPSHFDQPIMLGFGGLSVEEIKSGVQKLGKAIQALNSNSQSILE